MEASERELESSIISIRDEQVMLDSDLAELYGVETRTLNQAVTRNKERFPEDFMFKLSNGEWGALREKNRYLKKWGGKRKNPRVFTEHGVLMLSSVLNSERAVQVNIRIVRVYSRMRRMMVQDRNILQKMQELERELNEKKEKLESHDRDIKKIFNYLKRLISQKEKPQRKIGYDTPSKREERR
ncbi:MAG: ORF6N domain-containing protein [Flavobacteriales bacterium]